MLYILLTGLAFVVGFLSAFVTMAKCSQDKWEQFKEVIDSTRTKTGANE